MPFKGPYKALFEASQGPFEASLGHPLKALIPRGIMGEFQEIP